MAPTLELTLTTLSGEQTTSFPLSQHITTIGRLDENAIQIRHGCISRKHAVIELRHGHVFIHDLSTSGTWLNGVRSAREERPYGLRPALR